MRRYCPDYDAELVVETAGTEMTGQRGTYRGHECGTRWRSLEGEALVEDDETPSPVIRRIGGIDLTVGEA